MKKLKNILYKVKIRNGYIITRILCFRFKKKISANSKHSKKIKLFSPNIAHIGQYSYGSPDLYVASDETTIGKFCSLGMRIVLGHGIHPTSFLSSSPYFYFNELDFKRDDTPAHPEYWELNPIHVGNDVWIGDGVFVKNGVNIGDGAIIGARAVVTSDIPPYAIAVGVPAKIIKYRFSPEIIKQLLELKWWDLDPEIIKKIPYDNIDQAIEFIKKHKN